MRRQSKVRSLTLNDEGRVKLFKAKHPLIPADEVVANDIYLR